MLKIKDLNVLTKKFTSKKLDKRKNKAKKLLMSYITEKKNLNTLAKENHICIKTLKKT